MVKNLPAMQETQVRSLGGKDPLEKGMATPSSILAWRIPETEEPAGLYIVHGVSECDMTFSSLHFFRLYFGNTLTPKSQWCNSLAWLTQISWECKNYE